MDLRNLPVYGTQVNYVFPVMVWFMDDFIEW